jgi:hypothetical protein
MQQTSHEVRYFKQSIAHAAVAAKFSERVALVIIDTIAEKPVVNSAMAPNLAGMPCTIYKTTILATRRRDESAVVTIADNISKAVSWYQCTPLFFARVATL